MFDAVRNNKRIVQVFLALITLPFAFWGVDSYVRGSSGNSDVATVGDAKIGIQEYQNAVREQQDRLRNQLGAQFKPEMLDTPEAKAAILNNLVVQRLLSMDGARLRLNVSDDQLREIISNIPALQVDGKFSMARYEQALKGQGMTQASFEAKLRQELMMQQMPLAIRGSAILSKAASDRWVAIQLEERSIIEAVLSPEAYAAQVKLAADAEQKYYDANSKEFELPEQARVEYVVLSRDAMAAKITPSEDEIKKSYELAQERYRQKEERRASHILITVAAGAAEAEVKTAQAKASEVLAQLKKSPGDFAKLAKQYSGDPGSAEKGGDLGYFPRGAMVKPFEEAAFGLAEGQVSELVRSDFGFHIIKVTGIKGGKVKSLAEAREEVVAELRKQAGARQFAEAAEAFSELVYSQPDSLAPAVERFKLTVEQGGWLTRGQAAKGVLNHPKLLAALFAEDSTKKKHNTEAVEVAPSTLVSARIVEYKPAALRPLAEVKAGLHQKLVRQEAAKLARKDGEEKLAKLQKGEQVSLSWGANRTVSRASPDTVPGEALTTLFKASASALPVYAGGEAKDGRYSLYKLVAVKPANLESADPRIQAIRNQYQTFRGEDDLIAYLSALRARFPVKINKAVLESKDK